MEWVGRAGGEPVMAEDWPSLSATPRNACLDAVDSSDIYVGMVGERGGSTAPSGKLVVEEEFEQSSSVESPRSWLATRSRILTYRFGRFPERSAPS